jgi:hypothetical protein
LKIEAMQPQRLPQAHQPTGIEHDSHEQPAAGLNGSDLVGWTFFAFTLRRISGKRERSQNISQAK